MISRKDVFVFYLLFIRNRIFSLSLFYNPNFEREGDMFFVILPFNRDIHIIKYEIMQGDVDAEPDSYEIIYTGDFFIRELYVVIVDITDIDRTSKKCLSVCVTTRECIYYSKPFIFDPDIENYTLTERKSFYPDFWDGTFV